MSADGTGMFLPSSTVRASITRPFTQTECTTYNIDPCPTLAQSKTAP